MKKINIKNLKYDEKETKRIREEMAKQKSIKITINIDADTLKEIKSASAKSGIPYQRLLNRTLRESLSEGKKSEDRLDKIEKELRQLKKKIAA
jgi:predicted DNA binding CopG/RHH family protein